MTVRYPTLEDYLHTAAYVLDLPVETVIKASRLGLAESALHAPVLLVRLAKNHALPDGDKRAALATTIAFCMVNGYDWRPPAADDPDGEETFEQMRASPPPRPRTLQAVEAEVASWIAERLRPLSRGG